jgi:MFS family permease
VKGAAGLFRFDRTRLLCVVLFCNAFGIGAFGPLLPEIGRSQSLADWQLGLAAAAFGFSRMVAAMPTGLLVAHHLAATLMAAPVVIIVGTVLLVGAGPFPLLLAGRFLLGVAQTLAMIGGITAMLLEDHGPNASVRLNLFEFSGMLGVLGGLGLVAIAPEGWGWKASLLIATTPVLVSLLLIPAMSRVFPRAPFHERPDASAAFDRLPARRGSRAIVALMFGAGIVFALSWSAVSGFVVPIRGAREFGLSRTGISWLLAMSQTIDLIFLLPVGRAADRLGRGVVLGGVTMVLGLGTIGVGLGSLPWFALGCACFGLGLAGWMLPLGVIREHTPVTGLAWRTGLYRVGVDSAMFIGPFVAGVVGRDGEGIFLALIGGAALAIGARLLWRPSL